MSRTPPKTLHGDARYEHDLARELIAYFQLAASSIADPDRLEAVLDDLCTASDGTITKAQADARACQIQFVRNLLRDRARVEVLEEVRQSAMDAAYRVGGEQYVDAATRLTELQAEAHAALEQADRRGFETVVAQMKDLEDQANDLNELDTRRRSPGRMVSVE